MGAERLDEGRIARGFRLLGESWRYLRARPRLLVLPGMSAVLLAAAAVAIGVPTAVLSDRLDLPTQLVIFLVGSVVTFPLTVIATFLNVAFLLMVADDQAGREPSVREGLAGARARLRPILAWAALASGVGVLLAAIQQIPHVGGWVGRAVSIVGGLAWSLATFFVLPILALHGTGARESVRRSAAVFRERWGEAVTGDVAIGGATVLLGIPAWICGGIGIALLQHGDLAAGVAVTTVAVAVGAALFALQGAVSQLFQLSVYRLVASGQVVGPFAEADLERAVKPKRRWWRSNALD
jgi:hypothetical protein